MQAFVSIWLKFFFLLTPFFALSVFLSMTGGKTSRQKIVLALRVIGAACVVSVFLFFFGNQVFDALGITIDAFRIGGGTLLMLTAIKLVEGTPARSGTPPGGQENPLDEALDGSSEEGEIAVVPLAIPVTVGPGTTAALLIMGAETSGWNNQMMSVCALGAALASFGVILLCAAPLERLFGHRGITILSKLTGLVLAALSAQLIFTGVRAFLRG